MERFESRREREVPRLTPERVEDIGNEILDSPEAMEYLVKKIEDKIAFKQRISHDDGTNEFSTWKRLGIFIIHQQRLPRELVSILDRKGIDLYDEDVLELHIPPQDIHSIEDVSGSFTRLKEYLVANRGEGRIPKYIYGVSYLARLAKRWGFTVVDLPENIQEKSGAAKVLKSYADSTPGTKGAKIASKFIERDIKFCFISTEQLLDMKEKGGSL